MRFWACFFVTTLPATTSRDVLCVMMISALQGLVCVAWHYEYVYGSFTDVQGHSKSTHVILVTRCSRMLDPRQAAAIPEGFLQ